MNSKILVNGECCRELKVLDRGLHYGDGVFETMAFIDGKIRHWQKHYKRLCRAGTAFNLPIPSAAEIESDIDKLDLSATACMIVKLIITRGIGGAGYEPLDDAVAHSSRIVMSLPWPTNGRSEEEGLNCDFLKTTLGTSSMLAGHKHLNRLEQVLAAQELSKRGLDEGLLLNQEGFVIEAVSSNLILVYDDKVVTPDLACSGVEGITKAVIIEHARAHGINIETEYMFADTVKAADEIILCNSIKGLRPVGILGDIKLRKRTMFRRLAAIWNASYGG